MESPTEEREPLAATPVRYERGADMMTVHPRTDDEVALSSTWLSADAALFRPLEEWR